MNLFTVGCKYDNIDNNIIIFTTYLMEVYLFFCNTTVFSKINNLLVNKYTNTRS